MKNLSDSVQICLKIKPVKQESINPSSVFQILDNYSISLDNKLFKFDYISKDSSSLEELFYNVCKPSCDKFLSGLSISILAYGQVGSGKSFTMHGDLQEAGIIIKCCEFIIRNSIDSFFKFSCIEIFQEQIYDLLAPSVKGLNIKEDAKSKINLEGLYEENIKNIEDIVEILKQILKKTGGGKSHIIYTLKSEGKNTAKIQFIDLAGSERTKNSSMSSEKLKESSNANKSITILGNVIKLLSQKADYINFRDSKLTYVLKDSFYSSNLIVIATVVPLRKFFWEILNTLKFAQKAKRISSDNINHQDIVTIEYLQNEVFYLKHELEKLSKIESDYNIQQQIHSLCEKKIFEIEDKNNTLEEENKILRKEIQELNKIDNSDWLLSSDSEDQETIQILTKEKKDLEILCDDMHRSIENKEKKIIELEQKIERLDKEEKANMNFVKDLKDEIEELNKKCTTYQELSVLLSKQNTDLISELGKSKEICYEYIADFSAISSTDSSKCEIYKIIEEKDARVTNLLENTKTAEDNYQKLKEKYLNDTSAYKKQISRLKTELSLSKSENIKENAQAMKVLDELKQEKVKLLSIITNFNENTDKKKFLELREMNSVLLENLKIKGQQIADLQKQFENFLNDKGYSPDLIQKLNSKTQKLKNFQNEFYKIKAFLLKFSQFRQKVEKMSISECVIDIFLSFQQKKGRNNSIEDTEKLNFSHS